MMTLEQRIKSYKALSRQQGHPGVIDVLYVAQTVQDFQEKIAKLELALEEAIAEVRHAKTSDIS